MRIDDRTDDRPDRGTDHDTGHPRAPRARAAALLATCAIVASAVAVAVPMRPAAARPATPARPAGTAPTKPAALSALPTDSTYARQILLAVDPEAGEPIRADVVRVGAALRTTSAPSVVAGELRRTPWMGPRLDDGFTRYLGRPADPSGGAFWAAKLAGGDTDVEAFATALATSAESYRRAGSDDAAWVDALYEQVLERPADLAGHAYWVDLLTAGGSRSTVVRGLLRSPQRARGIVAAAYHRYLSRAADPGGLDASVRDYRAGSIGEQSLITRLLGGSEARNAGCDPFDTRNCLLPFPNDLYTVPDPATGTGRRVALKREWMPKNDKGVRIDPREWNRNDGFSVGQAANVRVPGIDLEVTGAAPINDIERSLDPDAPVVVIDATTGERHPVFVELDANIAVADQADDQLLYVRPAVNYTAGHRYIIAMRNLRDGADTPLVAPAAFRTYRDDLPSTNDRVQARRPHLESVFGVLADAGIARDDLYLAWDFTVASQENTTGRMLHIRDEALASLEGGAPSFQVATVTEDPAEGIARRVEGTFDVPLFLTGSGAAGAGFRTGTTGLPVRNGTFTANFDCEIPTTATTTPARPVVYGHGLFGDLGEVRSGPQRAMASQHNMVYCATDWIGMSEGDIGNAGTILKDASTFNTLADRSQQGILNTIFLGRLLVHDDGFASASAFKDGAGSSMVDTTTLFYDGNSQGAVIGGAFVALSPDVEAGVLGVAGMNYSTLLERSVDFDPFNAIFRITYPDPVDRVLGLGIFQMLWDRGETNGYAAHLTDQPLPSTGPHRVLIHVALGDHQVAPFTAEVEARTAGMAVHRPVYGSGRTLDVDPVWGLEALAYPSSGSGLVIWDSGAPIPPLENLAPRAGEDPHSDPRNSAAGQAQKSAFLRAGGTITDVCSAAPCTTPAT